MKGSRLVWSALLGCALVVGCEKKDEKTPTGAPAANSQGTEKSADEMKKKTEDASEAAKSAAADAGKEAKKSAEAASDTIKKNADSAAEAANVSPAAADASSKLKTVMDAIKDKKWDIAESTLKAIEANKSSLPAAMQTQVDNARKMLDAGKGSAALSGATSLPAGLPK